MMNEGPKITRPKIFPECNTCPEANAQLLKLRHETGGGTDLTIDCRVYQPGIWRFRWGPKIVTMARMGEYAVEGNSLDSRMVLKVANEAEPKAMESWFYERGDVTDKCPGIKMK